MWFKCKFSSQFYVESITYLKNKTKQKKQPKQLGKKLHKFFLKKLDLFNRENWFISGETKISAQVYFDAYYIQFSRYTVNWG